MVQPFAWYDQGRMEALDLYDYEAKRLVVVPGHCHIMQMAIPCKLAELGRLYLGNATQ